MQPTKLNGTTSLIGAAFSAVDHVAAVKRLLCFMFRRWELYYLPVISGGQKDHTATNYTPVPNISSAHQFQICPCSTYQLWQIAVGIKVFAPTFPPANMSSYSHWESTVSGEAEYLFLLNNSIDMRTLGNS